MGGLMIDMIDAGGPHAGGVTRHEPGDIEARVKVEPALKSWESGLININWLFRSSEWNNCCAQKDCRFLGIENLRLSKPECTYVHTCIVQCTIQVARYHTLHAVEL